MELFEKFFGDLFASPPPAGILAYFDTHMTSAAIEAVDGLIQLAKRMAPGFRNFDYHRAGSLDLAVLTNT